ncbi:MAG: hypothetical protein J5956_09170 [Ruminococcus sp.]|nr:hypothetical protein [Ruminococcus sp.]
MTGGGLTLFTLDSDGFGGMLALVILSGIIALVCMFISFLSMLSSNWKTASTLSIIAALFGLPWIMINPVMIALVIIYPVLVCSAAYFIGSKKKESSDAVQQTSESENITDEEE